MGAMKILLASLILGAFALLGAASLPLNPRTPEFRPLTPRDIVAGYKQEQNHKRVVVATKQAVRVFRHHGCNSEFAGLVGEASVETGLPASILAALIYVESTCRSSVISPRDAVGLCQVNPKIWHLTNHQLKDPAFNVRVGSHILATYVKRYGLKEGLHAYNGFGDQTDTYSTKVFEAAGWKT